MSFRLRSTFCSLRATFEDGRVMALTKMKTRNRHASLAITPGCVASLCSFAEGVGGGSEDGLQCTKNHAHATVGA